VKYAVITFGCRVNQADSLAIECELRARGGEADTAAHADVVIVNTCSVTASADQGARQTLRRIARENPRARIVATGCYASRCADEVASVAGVAEVIPNSEKGVRTFVARLLGADLRERSLTDGPCGRPVEPGLMGRTTWTLRVQTGCNESCSYCIIPTTRGPARSRTRDDILQEIAAVVAAGYKEVVLTGVHLGSYGRDLDAPTSLIELVRDLERAGPQLRISSLEPMDFPLQLLDLNCAPHFHLPLQHASNRMLAAMRRPYTIEFYTRLVGAIRERLPHAAIGTDIIAGFPGETDEDFEQLTSFLETSPLTHLHVFPYSDRPGTTASTMPLKVAGAVTKERAQRLREISRTLADRFRASQKGTSRPALTIDDGSMAVTDNYFRVAAPPGHGRNEWVTVTIN
jgi:threonylcarbamoyladenosine tRNA methylthiotransferase MtaB